VTPLDAHEVQVLATALRKIVLGLENGRGSA
jgi:hypothetical protein